MKNLWRWQLTLIGTTVVVGTSIWIFLQTLQVTIDFFQTHWLALLWGLPVATLLVAAIEKDNRLLSRRPWLAAPWIYVLTLIFHLFGASVGRETTAVKIGASLAEIGGRKLGLPPADHPQLLRIGLAAGFGAAFGLPWSGMLFAIESPQNSGSREWRHLPFYLLSSWGAHWWCSVVLGQDHSLWRNLPTPGLEGLSWACLLLFVFLMALCFFYEVSFRSLHIFGKRQAWWLFPGLGSLLFVVLTLWIGRPLYSNLGVPLLESAFRQPSLLTEAFGKLCLTFISLLSGMKGGEFTPLMSAGALFGSGFANLLPGFHFQLGGALGMVSLISSRLRIPFTATLMLVELFDWRLALLGFPLLLAIEWMHKKIISKLF